MNKRIFSILLATFLIFSINNVIAQEEDKDTNVKLNQIAPNFSATTIDGQKIELSKLKGKVVLVNFFAT
ncbi:redoxin domain-containing protein, partial [Bacteroidota bacterium]